MSLMVNKTKGKTRINNAVRKIKQNFANTFVHTVDDDILNKHRDLFLHVDRLHFNFLKIYFTISPGLFQF